MNYLQLDFEISDNQSSDMLMALLAQSGFESFEEETGSLKAYIREEDFDEVKLAAIIKIIPAKFTKTVIPQENWNAQWESSFEPILVNDFAHSAPWVAIRAGFHQPVKNAKHEIIITPKMSFGTGHHATTYLMINQMSHLIFAGKSVLDFGTGTGILSILAEKMEATDIYAIDNDEWSIENTKENITSNDCSKIKVHKGDTIPGGDKYDIILANINLNVIMQSLPAIAVASKTGTLILLSGFLEKDIEELSAALHTCLITINQIEAKDGWVCLLCKKD